MRNLLLTLLVVIVVFSAFNYLNASEPTKKEKFSAFLRNQNFSQEAVVIALATLPIFELRGSIPWAIHHYKMPWYKAYFLSVIGNFLPMPFILLTLKFGLEYLTRVPILKRFFDWIFKRTRKKSKVIKEYEALGLIMFVMIPLPITGGWTGSVAAYLFDIKIIPALSCILIGICCAGIIVTILSLFGIWGAVIAAIALISLLVIWGINIIKNTILNNKLEVKEE